MKKLTLAATDENVLQSIKENTYDRSNDIKDFIEALDLIEDNTFISLDAKWGEGKTFYVRQIEQTLKYLSSKQWGLPTANMESYFSKNNVLNSISLNYSYLPIYYDAWLYDNHDDPLMSLLLVIAKECKKYLNTKIDCNSVSDKVFTLLDSLSITIGNISVSGNLKKIKDVFVGQDILSSVKTAEEIRECVKTIFNDIIVEEAQKLVIFIDELDRCRPSFAIDMLERIKHYFDDDRIIIIASINKEQLVHTISKYYGVGFDSTGYLNKFFDMNVYLPIIDSYYDNRNLINLELRQYNLKKIAESLCEYYKLSLRDSLIFKQNISFIPSKIVNDHTREGCVLSAFVPIILILDIVNENERIGFLKGESNVLSKLFENVPALYEMACKFGKGNGEKSEENYKIGFSEIKGVYNYAFGVKNEKYYTGNIDISNDIKAICIKVCNGFEK